MDKYIYRGKLERVVDGDTIDALIDVGFDIWVKKRIRYKGIDTWESRTRNLEEKKLGLAAKDRNKELLEKISSKPGYFRLKSYGVGKYGRVLGEIFIQDAEGVQYNINEILIKEDIDIIENSEDEIDEFVNDKNVLLYSLIKDGWPVGFYMLDYRKKDICDLSFFGLVDEVIGIGLGKYLLQTAILFTKIQI